MRRPLLSCLLGAALAATPALANNLRPLLERGPLVLVEEDAGGKFGRATGIVLVDAPPEKVWETLLQMEKYVDFVPKVTTSEIVRKEANQMDVRFVLDVPGPDTDYTIRYAVDEKARELQGTWLKGDLKGSKWKWKVEPTEDGKALLSQQLTVKNFSSILTSVEDDQQTITIGVNVSSALAATKAIKRKAEGKSTVKK